MSWHATPFALSLSLSLSVSCPASKQTGPKATDKKLYSEPNPAEHVLQNGSVLILT